MGKLACRFCSKEIVEVLNLGSHPLANKLKAHSKPFPVRLHACYSCELIQLPLEEGCELFTPDYPYHTSVNAPYVEQCEQWAKRATRRWEIQKTDRILEIACNDGYLLKIFRDLGFDNLTGVEPIHDLASLAGNFASVHADLWSPKLAAHFGKFKLIVANNVLAHIPDINSFVWGIAHALDQDGVASIEVQDVNKMCQRVQFDTIYHEHLSYFSSSSLERLFQAHGMKLIHMEKIPSHGGSLRMAFSHKHSKYISHTNFDSRMPNMKLFKERVIEKRDLIAMEIRDLRGRGSIACFGAAAKGISMLNYTGAGKHISLCVDETPAKQGRAIPGSDIPIYGITALKAYKPDFLWILPWNYKDAIIEKTAFIREWGGEHVVFE